MFDKKTSEENLNTILAKGAFFNGKLRIEGGIRIDGDFDGELDATGVVVVGKDGLLKGDFRVKDAVIGGRLIGNLTAQQKIELQAGAHVEGDLHCKGIVIEHDVFFDGSCKMGEGEKPFKKPVPEVLPGKEKLMQN
jgi:cytoskeletal protein CcmA (bactofilin family)